ncbi:MAG: pyruvate dehydrogenase (acetyl-transferring), homodimeric type [Acidobacteriota bacterium]
MSTAPHQSDVDRDPQETNEWLDALGSVVSFSGRERAAWLLNRLGEQARHLGVDHAAPRTTDFVNTIRPEDEHPFPGDEVIEKRIRRIVRWNAMAMVSRANTLYAGLGGHLSTYASAASLYEIGFNHFFKGKDLGHSGDQIYFQGHAAPGIYSRAYLEGRLEESQLERFRREVARGKGLSSYPHPRLMEDFWEFPTVSMGLGPIHSIYQARFNRYLEARGIADTSQSTVWAFLGDGETDEPESLGAVSVASRENLDNLVWVVNCNLQRLDGPVRGNGKIIQELEAVFRGAGWNVIKVIWGRKWDDLLSADGEGVLRQRMNAVLDGELQKYVTEGGDYIRKHFFGTDPRLESLVSHLSDDEIHALRRGGHDYTKLYSAFRQASEHRGAPTAILCHTVKGWTLGHDFAARNTTHQMKKLKEAELTAFRDLLELPIPDAEVVEAPFYRPGPDSDEVQYLRERRHALGGALPIRRDKVSVPVDVPGDDVFSEFDEGTSTGEGVSTTMAFVRLLAKLLRHSGIGKRIVPIIPDEARTFGMDPLFRQVGIYSSKGQLYEPVDKGMLLYYREAKDGQVLEEGITEAGSMSSFMAAGTSHATHGEPMVPFYIFYSMFGFQRTGDQMWAFADARGRGFLMGATAGRTTLNGEGLQHQDGHSHVLSSTVPNILSYDPAFAYEVAAIIRDGLDRMVARNEDVFYYITLQNENYPMPPRPETCTDQAIREGMYLFSKSEKDAKHRVQLFGSGSIMTCVLKAQEMLLDFGVAADVWSVTSYQQLRNDALSCDRHARLHPTDDVRQSVIERTLDGVEGPFIAASDYMKVLPDMIGQWLPGRLVSLGTDGFGMSDTREELRRHFEVDAESIVIAALHALRREGALEASEVAAAIDKLGYDPDKVEPMSV